MLSIESAEVVQFIGTFLREHDYDVEHLSNDLGLTDGLFAGRENMEPLLEKTSGSTRLHLLARLFFVCVPVSESHCRESLPSDFIDACLQCGLLTETSGSLMAIANITPFRSLLVASDSPYLRASMTDMVVGPGQSTVLLARLAVGGQNETTLDLGTGTGILALEALGYSRQVVGTDLNPRTLRFAAFNACLNGLPVDEWREGDAFTPVYGQRFSRIVANPPFFLSPATEFTFCDSPLELDGFTARLAREAGAYLEEGGFFQMLGEWVDLERQPWQDRLREWTAASDCDVLVLPIVSLSPEAYAEKRTNEARQIREAGLQGSFNDRLYYLRRHGVQKVIGGAINLRRRPGAANWFAVVNASDTGSGPIGPHLQARFENLTYLASISDDKLLAAKLRLSGDAVLDHRYTASEGKWETKHMELRLLSPLPDVLRLDAEVCAFLPLFNGQNDVASISIEVAKQLHLDHDEARRRCMQLVRRLLQSTFVHLA